MVKRHKTGRRQILQLEDKKPPPPTTSTKNIPKNLLHYSDSDDDAKNSPCDPEPSIPSASEPVPAASMPIDSQVADFLKEIDALAVSETQGSQETSETEPKQQSTRESIACVISKSEVMSNIAKDYGDSNKETNTNTPAATTSNQGHQDVYCVWQQCQDESSGYTYFWNMHTNEVTWDCPPEYMAYLRYLNSAANVVPAQSSQPVLAPPTKSKTTTKVIKKKKKKHSDTIKEGTIIPISYFGGSSSSESSSDEGDSDPKNKPDSDFHQTKRSSDEKMTSKISSKRKKGSSSKSKKESGESIGPQLPPGFQFSETVPLTPCHSDNADGVPYKENNEVTPPVFGPQLPPQSSVINEDSTECIDGVPQKDSEAICVSHQSEAIEAKANGGPSVVDSSQEDANWDDSLLITEEEFQLTKDPYENNCPDVPDSTTKKEVSESPLVNVVDNSREAKAVSALASVAAYDSDSDADEVELSSSSVQPMSPNVNPAETVCPENSVTASETEPVESKEVVVSEQENQSPIECMKADEPVCSTILETSISDNNVSSPHNSPFSDNYAELLDSELMANSSPVESTVHIHTESPLPDTKAPSRKVCSDIFDNLYSLAHKRGGNYGFGFSRQLQLDLEDEILYSGNENSNSGSRKGYSKISFVKSDDVLDLSSLNEAEVHQENNSDTTVLKSEHLEPKVPSTVSEDLNENELPSCSLEMHNSKEKDIVESPLKDEVMIDISISNNVICDTENKNAPASFDEVPIKIEHQVPSTVPEKETLNNINNSLTEQPKKLKTKKKRSKVKLEPSEPEKESLVIGNGDIDDIDEMLNNILKEKQEADRLKNSQAVPSSQIQPVAAEAKVETVKPESSKVKKRSTTEPSSTGIVKKKRKIVSEEKKEEASKEFAASIIDLSTLLVDKLTFLLSNHSTMTSLSTLLVQIQTRLVDWQMGALAAKYFIDRLDEVQQYLHNYEISIMSGDWSCQWDRENKRYFYVNGKTQQSQWTFPSEISVESSTASTVSWDTTMSSPSVTFQSAGAQFPLVSSSISEERVCNKSAATVFHSKTEDEHEMPEAYPSTSKWSPSEEQVEPSSSPPPPPPGVDSPPPPPPPRTPPPTSPPPPPPDSTEIEDREIPDVDMDLEDSNSSDSAIFISSLPSVDVQSSQNPLKKLFYECTRTRSPDHHLQMSTNVVSSTSNVCPSESATITKPPQPISSANESVSHTYGNSSMWTTSSVAFPSCSSALILNQSAVTTVEAPRLFPIAANHSAVMVESEPSGPSVANLPSSSSHKQATSPPVTAPAIKEKKKKSKLLAGLALKKKNIPSLVQKWQKIKEEQEKGDPKISTSMK